MRLPRATRPRPRCSLALLAALTLAAALLWPACGGASTSATPAPAPAPRSMAEDAALLVVPVPQEAAARDAIAAALARLAQHGGSARADAVDAAWTRAHYLLDVFDDARVRAAPASRALLHRALGRAEDAPQRGPEASAAVLDALAIELDAILARQRLHEDALAARALVRYDRAPLLRAEVHGRMNALDAVARGGNAVSANARLRLAGYCQRALADAPQAPAGLRRGVVAHCLYALYPADPAAYFAPDPAARPPMPAWRVLAADTDALLAAVASESARLAPAALTLRERLGELEPALAQALPAALDPMAAGLTRIEGGRPYDNAPLLDAAAASAPADELAAAVPASAPAWELVDAAAQARSRGARALQLLAWREQTLERPPGDYWRVHPPPDNRLARLVVVPVRLSEDLVSDAAADTEANGAADALALGLHLRIARDTWQILSPSGALPAIAASSAAARAPEQALAEQLRAVADAFATPQHLVLVPGDQVTAGAVIAAADAAWSQRAADGQPALASLGLAANAPVPRAQSLAARIERRNRARVTLAPAPLEARAALLRACYRRVLDRAPKAKGALRLSVQASEIVISGSRDPELRACARELLIPLVRERGIPSATAEFSLTPETTGADRRTR
ncbi:hypothetical protein [Haliangium ochraceum]|nr:hypothetical protein [Haliangium ochraceum]